MLYLISINKELCATLHIISHHIISHHIISCCMKGRVRESEGAGVRDRVRILELSSTVQLRNIEYSSSLITSLQSVILGISMTKAH